MNYVYMNVLKQILHKLYSGKYLVATTSSEFLAQVFDRFRSGSTLIMEGRT